MILDPNQKEAIRTTMTALKLVNEGLVKMRSLSIGCNLREHEGNFFLDAKAIIKPEHYAE